VSIFIIDCGALISKYSSPILFKYCEASPNPADTCKCSDRHHLRPIKEHCAYQIEARVTGKRRRVLCTQHLEERTGLALHSFQHCTHKENELRGGREGMEGCRSKSAEEERQKKEKREAEAEAGAEAGAEAAAEAAAAVGAGEDGRSSTHTKVDEMEQRRVEGFAESFEKRCEHCVGTGQIFNAQVSGAQHT
jgi:hypothetical protein